MISERERIGYWHKGKRIGTLPFPSGHNGSAAFGQYGYGETTVYELMTAQPFNGLLPKEVNNAKILYRTGEIITGQMLKMKTISFFAS